MNYKSITLGGGAGKTRTAAPGSSNMLKMYATYSYLSWGDMMTGMFNTPAAVKAPEPTTKLEQSFRVWRDMVENPAQYGDDIVEWLALDEELRASRKCWKVERYWRAREEEAARKERELQSQWREAFTPIAKEAAALGARRWVQRDIKACVRKFRGSAIKIQSAVRGHQARTRQTFRDCCMCLSHRICPLKTDAGFMCRGCAEQGPYEDITGPLSDPWNWFRADFVDLTKH